MSSTSLAPGHRASILRAYRELLVLIKRLRPGESAKAWDQARSEVRAHKGERDPVKATDLLKDLIAKVGYLRVRTPRLPGDATRFNLAGRYVVRDGAVIQGEADRVSSTADYQEGRRGLPVDQGSFVQRHEQLLSRQLGGNRAPAGWAPRDVQIERALSRRRPGQPLGDVLGKRK